MAGAGGRGRRLWIRHHLHGTVPRQAQAHIHVHKRRREDAGSHRLRSGPAEAQTRPRSTCSTRWMRHLDAPNSERLANILEERSQNSQFIMVSLKEFVVQKAGLGLRRIPKERRVPDGLPTTTGAPGPSPPSHRPHPPSIPQPASPGGGWPDPDPIWRLSGPAYTGAWAGPAPRRWDPARLSCPCTV